MLNLLKTGSHISLGLGAIILLFSVHVTFLAGSPSQDIVKQSEEIVDTAKSKMRKSIDTTAVLPMKYAEILRKASIDTVGMDIIATSSVENWAFNKSKTLTVLLKNDLDDPFDLAPLISLNAGLSPTGNGYVITWQWNPSTKKDHRPDPWQSFELQRRKKNVDTNQTELWKPIELPAEPTYDVIDTAGIQTGVIYEYRIRVNAEHARTPWLTSVTNVLEKPFYFSLNKIMPTANGKAKVWIDVTFTDGKSKQDEPAKVMVGEVIKVWVRDANNNLSQLDTQHTLVKIDTTTIQIGVIVIRKQQFVKGRLIPVMIEKPKFAEVDRIRIRDNITAKEYDILDN